MQSCANRPVQSGAVDDKGKVGDSSHGLIKRILPLIVLGTFAYATAAWADSRVTTVPVPTTSTNASGTITTTNTFQKVFSATTPAVQRLGCTIENNGTHTMYVTENLGISASTTSNSAQLSPGQAYYCGALGGPVLIGEIDITGTSGDAFYATSY